MIFFFPSFHHWGFTFLRSDDELESQGLEQETNSLKSFLYSSKTLILIFVSGLSML